MMYRLFKYILFAVVIALILNFVPNLNLSRDNMLGAVIIGTAILAVLDRLLMKKEGMVIVSNQEVHMEEAPQEQHQEAKQEVIQEAKGCDIPHSYKLNRQEEDASKTGLDNNYDYPDDPLLQKGQFEKYMMGFDKVRKIVDQQRYNYDVHGPGYYLLNNGEFSTDGVPYSKAKDIICASKLNDLYNQHNFNYRWTPHTHLGKARGYLNWETTAP